MPFSAVDFNTDPTQFSPSLVTNKFTVLVTGRYLCTYGMRVTGTSGVGGSSLTLQLRKNGATFVGFLEQDDATGQITGYYSGATILDLVANDYLEVRISHNFTSVAAGGVGPADTGLQLIRIK